MRIWTGRGIVKKREKTIQKLIKCEEADVHFLVGGTETNLTVIAAALRPYEAVIAVDSGHWSMCMKLEQSKRAGIRSSPSAK